MAPLHQRHDRLLRVLLQRIYGGPGGVGSLRTMPQPVYYPEQDATGELPNHELVARRFALAQGSPGSPPFDPPMGIGDGIDRT